MHTQLTPPGPDRSLLPIKHLWAFRQNLPAFLSNLTHEYGDLVRLKVGRRSIYLINHPEYIEKILERDQASFIKGLASGIDHLGHGPLPVKSEGPFQEQGCFRRALESQMLAGWALTTVEAALQMGNSWVDGQSVEVMQEMRRLALRIAARILFAVGEDEKFERLERLAVQLQPRYLTLGLPSVGPFPRLLAFADRGVKNALKRLEIDVQVMIADRQGSSANGDFIELFMDTWRSNAGQPEKSAQDALCFAIVPFLFGYASLADLLAWTWRLLAEHPQAQASLHAELDSVLMGRLPVLDDLERLVFTRRVLAEVLRLYPPVWKIQRQAIQDYRLGGYLIPAGAALLISPWVMQRDPRYYPEPQCFDPQRWTPSAAAGRPHYAYLPFGGGVHACPGEESVWIVSTLILATLAQGWRFRLAPGQMETLQAKVMLRPKNRMRIQIERR